MVKKLYILSDGPKKFAFRRPFCIQIFYHHVSVYPKFNDFMGKPLILGAFRFLKKVDSGIIGAKLFCHQIKLTICITYVNFSVDPT